MEPGSVGVRTGGEERRGEGVVLIGRSFGSFFSVVLFGHSYGSFLSVILLGHSYRRKKKALRRSNSRCGIRREEESFK